MLQKKCFIVKFPQFALSLDMVPWQWHTSVTLTVSLLLSACYGERLEEEPDSSASVGLNQSESSIGSRQGRSMSKFLWHDSQNEYFYKFTFDVGCQEGVQTLGLNLNKLSDVSPYKDHVSPRDSLKHTTLTHTTRVLGLDYKGKANKTIYGSDCLVWADSDFGSIGHDWIDWADWGGGEHNHCRNIGGTGAYGGVQCLASFGTYTHFVFCPVPKCTQPVLDIPALDEFAQPHARTQDWNVTSTPSSWTICSAFMLDAWHSTKYSELSIWKLFGYGHNFYFASSLIGSHGGLSISATESGMMYTVRFPIEVEHSVRIFSEKPVFPGRWIRSCFSYQQMGNKTQLRLVVDGEIIGENNFEEEYEYKLTALYYYLAVGQVDDSFGPSPSPNPSPFRGKATDVNMFSYAMSIETMVGMTDGRDRGNCRIEGDFISWLKSSWYLKENATRLDATMLQMDKQTYSLCRRESSINIFMMDGLHRQEDCMRHCQKLGGLSPPVNTLQQWLAMQSEIEATALEEVNLLPDIWLSVTEGDLKGRLTRLPNWSTTDSAAKLAALSWDPENLKKLSLNAYL